MHCWSESCKAPVADKAAACPACGALLFVRDKYRIVGLCGEGGMGVVYEAVDEGLDRTVALKLMHGRMAQDAPKRERFFTETKAMAKLDHPSIARIYASDSHYDQLFFVQQFVKGRVLRAAAQEVEGGLSVSRCTRLAMDVLDALSHAHGHGIVHRDVNPNNILVVDRAAELHPVLIDFGMARIADQDATRVAWGGTPGYAAPEQILDPESNDQRSDIYAVGAVLYALISAGRVPYHAVLTAEVAKNPRAMLKAYQSISLGEVNLARLTKDGTELAEPLTGALERALAPKPDDRFQSAAEMLTALRATLQLEGAEGTSDAGLPFAKTKTQPSEQTDENAPTEPIEEVQRDEAPTEELTTEQVEPAEPNPPAKKKERPGSANRSQARAQARTAFSSRFVLGLVGVAVAGIVAVYFLATIDFDRAETAVPATARTAVAAPADAAPSGESVGRRLPLLYPGGLAVAKDGALTVADQGNHRIQQVTRGKLVTLAGSSREGFEDGAAAEAEFNRPSSVALAADGTVIVADRGNHRIRAIKDGQVSTLAGGFEGDHVDGAAGEARFRLPEGVAVAADGAVFVADTGNHCIRKISDGQVTTVAGMGQPAAIDGPAATARFNAPAGLALGDDGTLYVSDAGNRTIRALSGGKVSTVARLDPATELAAEAASTRFPLRPGVAIAAGAELVVTDPATHRVLQLRQGKLVVLAGVGEAGFKDGHAPKAKFSAPSGAAFGPGGVLYVADLEHGALRRIHKDEVRTLISSPRGGYADGASGSAEFQRPWAVAIGTKGRVLIADWGNRRVRALAQAQVSTLAGAGEAGAFDGAASDAQFEAPWDLAVHDEAVYVVDGPNHKIRVIEGTEVKTLAGTGKPGSANGPVSFASFHLPEGIAVDARGVIYVADTGNHLIRTIEEGVVGTLAGNGQSGLANGEAAKAQFQRPGAVAVASDGAVYVADAGNHCVRRIHEGRVHTLAGTGEAGFADGQQAEAQFEAPIGIAVVPSGAIYVADSGNHRIRRIDKGIVSTVAGNGQPGFADGPALDGMLAQPAGVAVAADGTVFVADAANHLIRSLTQGRLTTLAGH